MRVLAISDIHGYLPPIKVEADVLLVVGDLVPDGFNPIYQDIISNSNKGYWLRNAFSDWCESAPVKHVVVVAGNHDIPIMNNPGLMKDVSCIYLQGDDVEIDGIKIHGSPWTPSFGPWAFMKDDSALAEEWEKIPNDVDILMTHGPARGILDKTDEFYGGYNVGSATLRNRLDYGDFPNLKLHVFGHIHPAHGVEKLERDNGSPITFANVCHVNSQYEPANNAMFFEV